MQALVQVVCHPYAVTLRYAQHDNLISPSASVCNRQSSQHSTTILERLTLLLGLCAVRFWLAPAHNVQLKRATIELAGFGALCMIGRSPGTLRCMVLVYSAGLRTGHVDTAPRSSSVVQKDLFESRT